MIATLFVIESVYIAGLGDEFWKEPRLDPLKCLPSRLMSVHLLISNAVFNRSNSSSISRNKSIALDIAWQLQLTFKKINRLHEKKNPSKRVYVYCNNTRNNTRLLAWILRDYDTRNITIAGHAPQSSKRVHQFSPEIVLPFDPTPLSNSNFQNKVTS